MLSQPSPGVTQLCNLLPLTPGACDVSKHLPASHPVGLTGAHRRRQRCDQGAARRPFGGKISTKMITPQETLRIQDSDLQGG